MILYRLSKAAHANDLTGQGAYANGGRWNSKGVPMIYASESRALCALEVAVHLPLGITPVSYQMVELEIKPFPEKIYTPTALPVDWKAVPPSDSSRKKGDEFASAKKYLIMKVPSAIIPGEFNYLLNPLHPGMKTVRIKNVADFVFDQRLVK